MIEKELIEAVNGAVKHYRNDLALDEKLIAERRGEKFLHFAGECGTFLEFLSPADSADFPQAGETVPYLFGSADRNHIVEGRRDSVHYYRKTDRQIVHYYDGEKLRRIDHDRAERIVDTWAASVLHAWKK